MILDTSALLAIIFRENGFEHLLEKLSAADVRLIGAPTVVECGIVLSARIGQDARGLLNRLLDTMQIQVVPFTEEHMYLALRAWLRFGKGRHPAALNFGDCLTYALVAYTDLPLLCVGNDFAQTDLPLA